MTDASTANDDVDGDDDDDGGPQTFLMNMMRTMTKNELANIGDGDDDGNSNEEDDANHL